MSSRTPWTDADLTLLKELVTRRVSVHVIALKIGRSVSAIEAKAAQHGIGPLRIKRRYRRRAKDPPAHESSGNSG